MNVAAELAGLVGRAVDEAQGAGVLPEGDVAEPLVERPQRPDHGDYACSLPLKLARSMRMRPTEIAQAVVDRISGPVWLQRVWAAPPGFINFELSGEWLARQVGVIRAAGTSYGDVPLGRGRRVQVEFVSVNPTGPLHVGHARGRRLRQRPCQRAGGRRLLRAARVLRQRRRQPDGAVQPESLRSLSPGVRSPGRYTLRRLSRRVSCRVGRRYQKRRGRPVPPPAGRGDGGAGAGRDGPPADAGADTRRHGGSQDRLRRLVQRAESSLRRAVRSRHVPPPGRRLPRRTGWRHVVQVDGPGRRQGQGRRPQHRRAHILRNRCRLPLRQVLREEVRQGDRRPWGRPPGPRLLHEGDGVGDRGGPGAARPPHLPAGDAQTRRGDGAPVEAGRRRHNGA